MKKGTEIIILEVSYVLMLISIFVIPPFFTDCQSIISNTITGLGAYSIPCSLIVNTIFVLLAIGSLISGWKYYEGRVFPRFILLLFCLFFMFAALFDPASAIYGDRTISVAGQLHYYFVANAWLAFIILTFSTYTILKSRPLRNLTIVTALSAALLSIMVSESDKTDGIWHRLLLIISFGWMICTFRSTDR